MLTLHAVDINLLRLIVSHFDFMYLLGAIIIEAIGTVWKHQSDPQSATCAAGAVICQLWIACSIAMWITFYTAVSVSDTGLVGRREKRAFLVLGLINTLVQVYNLLHENNVSQPLCVAALCVSHQKLQMSTTTTVTAFLIRYLLRTFIKSDEFVLLKTDLQFRVNQRPDESEVRLDCRRVDIYRRTKGLFLPDTRTTLRDRLL